MPKRISVVALLSLVVASASQQAPSSKFVITKGKDTVGIELFSRDASTLSSEIHLATGFVGRSRRTCEPTVQSIISKRRGSRGKVSRLG